MFGRKTPRDEHPQWHHGKNDRQLLEALIEDAINKNGVLENIMADFSKLDANVAQLDTDVATLIAQGSGTGVEDPAIQAGIDNSASAVAGLDAQVVAALTPIVPPTPTPSSNGGPSVPASDNPNVVTPS